MIRDNKIWVANNDQGEPLFMVPKMCNRHGLIAGATGTGKTVTLKVLAESFSDIGVPVFLADVKGDLAGMVQPGQDSENMQERIKRFGLADFNFSYHAYPATFWDLYGEKGIPLRATVSEMGPLLLSQILGLNDLQSDLLSIAFKIADDNSLLLIDTKDLKSMLNYMSEHDDELKESYGRISKTSIASIVRSVVALEIEGGEKFFFEPALNITDWFSTDTNGRGMINILDSSSLIENASLYSIFLLWMMSELFETLPEVGDLDRPKMIFFFDEAHLLFDNAPKILIDKIEQVVKLIRSKGVGIFFITQNPGDIPDGVLAQLSNKIQHALHAYTPSDQKAVRAAAESFRENPDFDTEEVIQALGTGEALVSFLDDGGVPTICEKAYILPPQSYMGSISDDVRRQSIQGSVLYTKYFNPVDPDSAYEFLKRKGLEEEQEKEREQARLEEEKAEAKRKAQEEKEAAKAEAKAEREAEREKEKEANARKRAIKNVGSAVTGTIGREMGKTLGGTFGSFGKSIGGNLGASLGRGILSTLFKL